MIVFDNIEKLVDPNSQGAKMAKYKQKNPELYLKRPTQSQKSKLPGIKGSTRGKKSEQEEDIEPLKQISVNYKSRDVEFVHFKIKNAMSPSKFNS
jgi:hypothetical protein